MAESLALKSVSARVRVARRAAQLTQAEVASLLGVGRSAVAQWERPNGSRPSVTHLTALAQKLECSFEWLATGRGARAVAAGDGGEDTAVVMRHFAHDDDEERVLAVFRGLDDADREMVVSLAESLSAKALLCRKTKR